VFYIKDGIPGVELEVCRTPENKSNGGFKYPVMTPEGKPFIRNGQEMNVVDELDLMSEAQHKEAVQKKNEERGKLRQVLGRLTQLGGKKR
jgi:hypothetical protein